MSKLELSFGYGAGVPDGALAAWGARAIVGGGYLDVPPDRISFSGEAVPKAKLIEKLKVVGPIKLAEAKIREVKADEPVSLYEDEEFAVVGRMAGGYFYLAAYIKPEKPGIVLSRKAEGPPGVAAAGPIWLKLVRNVLASEDKDVFKLLEVGPGEDGEYRESYEGADIVFPSLDESIVRVVPKSDEAAAVIDKALKELAEGIISPSPAL